MITNKLSDEERQKMVERNKEYYESNKAKRMTQMKEYNKKNKESIKAKRQEYYLKNKDIIKAKTKEYKADHIEESKEYSKAYWGKNKEYLKTNNASRNRRSWKNMTPDKKKKYWTMKNAWEKDKKETDINFAIKKRLRLRVWQAFNGVRKKHSDELGINYNNIISHLNKTIPIDYKDNPSKYEIDHIIPLSSFDLTDPEQIKKAFAPENHQWLTSSENAIKSNSSPEEWKIKKIQNNNPKPLYTSESDNIIMITNPITQEEIAIQMNTSASTPIKKVKEKKIRPTDLNPSYSHIAGDPKKNERINFKHWNDLLFGKDNDDDTTYSNLWLYRNPQKVAPFRDDIGSPSQTQAKALGKPYFSEFNPLVAENIINFWSDENNTILDPFAGRIRGIVAGLKHRYYIGFEVSPQAHKSILGVIDEGKDKFDPGYLPTIHCEDSMNMDKYNIGNVDMIFSCPPYHNLEQYESVPGQLSDIADHNTFLIQMKEIMRLSLAKLKDNGFCALVVGDYRVGDKLINFDWETVKMMEELGVQLWDKIILQNINFGWAGIKFGHVKHKRITSKVTEYLLVFKKIPKSN
jgi:hypothetical protein